MTHALFEIYPCVCESGCKQRTEYEAGGGHHVPWQKMALAIEKIERSDAMLFRSKLDLGRELNFAVILGMGYLLPSGCSALCRS